MIKGKLASNSLNHPSLLISRRRKHRQSVSIHGMTIAELQMGGPAVKAILTGASPGWRAEEYGRLIV
jgi:hypothetical protein